MRVFERPAFFIHLIRKTVKGIRAFLLLLIIILLLFTNVLYVLNVSQNQTRYMDHLQLYPEELENQNAINAFLHFYLISLGEFVWDDYGNRGEKQKIFLWFIFLAATFLI